MSTSPINIRAASVADIPAITTLVDVLNRSEGYKISASAEALTAALFSQARMRLKALVAEQAGQVQGVVLYYDGYDTVSATYGYHLADIVVAETTRGKGMGTALFNALAAQVLAEKGEWISLTVQRKNARAMQFYKRRGMIDVSVNFMAIGPQALARCAKGTG